MRNRKKEKREERREREVAKGNGFISKRKKRKKKRRDKERLVKGSTPYIRNSIQDMVWYGMVWSSQVKDIGCSISEKRRTEEQSRTEQRERER